MARVKLGYTNGAFVEYEGGDGELEKLDALANAAYDRIQRCSHDSPGPAEGVHVERRGTPDHRDPNGKSRFGFGPIKAEES